LTEIQTNVNKITQNIRCKIRFEQSSYKICMHNLRKCICFFLADIQTQWLWSRTFLNLF